MMKYDSGSAEADAEKIPGPSDEPWLNVLATCEPVSPPALEQAIGDPATRSAVRGKIIDVGAGTCWATARLSKLPEVTEVVALDLSEQFLTTVGGRIISKLSGQKRKNSLCGRLVQ